MNERYVEYLQDRLAQKHLGFWLGFETGSMDPSVRPLPYPDSRFEAFKVDSSKFTEHAKPRLVVKAKDEEKGPRADPPSYG